MQQSVSETIADMTGVIRSQTNLPIAVGFGISNPEQARQVANCSDAIVVGSAIVNQIAEHGDTPEMPKQVAEYVKTLVEAIK
jgi:tryptophan synthase alpha chain